MKRLILALMLAMPLCAFGQTTTGTIKLTWDPNPAGQMVTKYSVYQAPAATGPWTKVQDVLVPTTTATITGLAPGSYWFRVTAVSSAWGESPPSNVVSSPPAATAPVNITIQVTITQTVP